MGVQTLKKPPLQYERNSYDIYNFMDNAFNDNGPKFHTDHIYEQNEGIAGKRQLDDWERMQISERESRRR